MKTIYSYIISAGIVFDNAIINNQSSITDMPPVQFSILASSLKQDMIQNRKKIIEKMVDAILFELERIKEHCNYPSKENLLSATLEQPLHWDPVENFTIGEVESKNSYSEQKFAITDCKHTIGSIFNCYKITHSYQINCYLGSSRCRKIFFV